MYVIDFETKPIEFGSGRAPAPVGVSIGPLSRPEDHKYYAFGHPTENNCTEDEARAALASVWDQPLLFHHGKFDLAVALEHWGLPWHDKFDDTLYLAYLFNPHERELGLKSLAAKHLGMPAEERNEILVWLISNGVVPSNTKDIGEHIWKAPGSLVGRYAVGDTVRTGAFFQYAYETIVRRMMVPAYEREIKLAKYLYEAEVRGVPINRESLAEDIVVYEAMLEMCEGAIQARLGDMPIETPDQVAKALDAAGYQLRRTKTGRLSTAQDALMAAIKDDHELLQLLQYRGACKTLLQTFMRPWMHYSERDGRLHPNWNQTKSEQGTGTRTGRLSCSSPNLQNVPTEFEFDYTGILAGFAPLPYMRQYILPLPGEVLLAADFNGQEMRLLAHFAEGKAAEIYRTDPRADFHRIAVDLVEAVAGMIWKSHDPSKKRKQAKITGFSLIYGAGVPALASQLGVDPQDARTIKKGYLRAIPGLADFQDDVSSRSEVRTWGCRVIPVEPPKENEDGSYWTFNYKLVNHLIQGTAADQTKQSIIDYHEAPGRKGSFMLTVHDENVVSVKLEDLITEAAILSQSMESLPGFDVPFIVEMEYGYDWHNLTSYEIAR